MAEFALRNLSVLSYAQGFTRWHFRAASLPLAQALAPGFFNPAADMMLAGDMVDVSAADGGATVFIHSGGNDRGDPVRFEVMARTVGAVR